MIVGYLQENLGQKVSGIWSHDLLPYGQGGELYSPGGIQFLFDIVKVENHNSSNKVLSNLKINLNLGLSIIGICEDGGWGVQ